MSVTPWYRQFWPWFLFSLPAIVVVAGLTTWWIAARHADDLVVDDYYQEGLTINRELGKQQRAGELGIVAILEANPRLIRVSLEAGNMPAALQLQLSHPFDAALDRGMPLAQVRPGFFEAQWDAAGQPRWLWRLEPIGAAEAEHWRIDGELTLTADDEH
jgi:hypothetical protein